MWQICGGVNSGAGADTADINRCCPDGATCTRVNPWHWQCEPGSGGGGITSSSWGSGGGDGSSGGSGGGDGSGGGSSLPAQCSSPVSIGGRAGCAACLLGRERVAWGTPLRP
jgi:hypothetical protein